jgi:hypothetical protein
MSFKVIEQNGNWAVVKDSAEAIFDGEPIDYEDYVELRDSPHKIKDKFERRNGKLVKKKPKDS